MWTRQLLHTPLRIPVLGIVNLRNLVSVRKLPPPLDGEVLTVPLLHAPPVPGRPAVLRLRPPPWGCLLLLPLAPAGRLLLSTPQYREWQTFKLRNGSHLRKTSVVLPRHPPLPSQARLRRPARLNAKGPGRPPSGLTGTGCTPGPRRTPNAFSA